MNTNKKTSRIFEDVKIDVKVKLSALWAAVMFLYIYVDYFALYIPGIIEQLISGELAFTGIQINQVFLLAFMILMTIPILMIVLSLTLKPKVNRWTNIIVGILYIVVSIGGMIGESWAFYLFGSIVEIALLSLIVWTAWKWPKPEGN